MGQCHQSGKEIWAAVGGKLFPLNPITIKYSLYQLDYIKLSIYSI